MIAENNQISSEEIIWSAPTGMKQLSVIFGVHRNTMSKWLKNQIICNRQRSNRLWQVGIGELPFGIKDVNRLYEVINLVGLSNLLILVDKLKGLELDEIRLLVQSQRERSMANVA